MTGIADVRAAVIGTGFIGTVHVEQLRRIGVQVRGVLGSTPERGAANSDVVALLAEVLDVDARALRIVAGQASRDKVVAVDGVSLDEAERRLASGGPT